MHANADSPVRSSPDVRQYPHLLRLLHWVLSISLGILLATGLSLHAAARPDWSLFDGVVPPWLWRGRVYLWHYWASVAFLPTLLGALVLAWPRRRWLRPSHVILLGGSAVALLSGLWMMFSFGSPAAMKVVVGLHAACGLVVLPLALVWHVVRALTTQLKHLVPSFRPLRDPQWPRVVLMLPLAVATTWIMFEGWPLRPPWRNLLAPRIDRPASPAGDLRALPWGQAPPLVVRMVNGTGFDSGQTDLVLQALHDGNQFYLKAQWNDPRADYNYFPWKKTEDGWEYLQTNPKNETVHYEDKFSLVFPIRPSWPFEQTGCAIHCHVDGRYGWGYKGGSPDIDVWHWKSVRSDPVGQADDKYWSVVDLEAKDVGRHGDPKDGGGYAKNVSDPNTHPAWLPAETVAAGQGAIPAESAVPYTAEAAEKIPPGTIIPGILVAAFQGDRGDVSCQSEHRDDRWTLYLRRKLDTGSEHDVAFLPGGIYPFGCAAFDCAAKRHAYSIPVYRLVLEE